MLVAYAPLAENLNQALAEYTDTDQAQKPVGKNIDAAVDATTELIGTLDDLCAGYNWRRQLDGGPKGGVRAATGLTEFLRSPATPGNDVGEGEPTLGDRYRRLANQLARAWSLCSGNETLDHLRTPARFYEEVRVYMGKWDARERQASGQPIPDDIQRMLADLVASSTDSGDIVDIYEAAGIPKPTLAELGPEFTAKAQEAPNPHLAIEALRDMLTEESGKVSRHNLVRQRAF